VLVLPGYPTAHEAELREHASARGVHEDVRFPGWVPAEQVEGLWRLASAFVFPSLYEGFGLPVLEAMACGTPVVAASEPALREVGGDAVVYAEDGDYVAAVRRALAERERLVAAGLERARRFSWAETARLTVEAYRQVLA
jgi:glycosyltransferase involved in cell wall biosynthesis